MIHSLVLYCPLVDRQENVPKNLCQKSKPLIFSVLYLLFILQFFFSLYCWKWSRPVGQTAILLPEWRLHTRPWAVLRWTASGRIDRWVCVRGLCGSNRQEPAPSAKSSIYIHNMLMFTISSSTSSSNTSMMPKRPSTITKSPCHCSKYKNTSYSATNNRNAFPKSISAGSDKMHKSDCIKCFAAQTKQLNGFDAHKNRYCSLSEQNQIVTLKCEIVHQLLMKQDK